LTGRQASPRQKSKRPLETVPRCKTLPLGKIASANPLRELQPDRLLGSRINQLHQMIAGEQYGGEVKSI
jgi:hypothetical protein